MKAQTASDTMKIVAYYRVSTKRQNLGLDAQRTAVHLYAEEKGAEIVAEFSEKESGKLNEYERPALNRAMATTFKNKATLVAAKADRISRDLSYAAQVFFHSNIKVVALNMPEEAMDNALIFGVYYGLAQHEAKMISQRTKAALKALKEQGIKLGRPDAATSITDEMRENASEARTRNAEINPNNVASINEIRRYLANGGKRTYQAIANHLTEAGYKTSRGSIHTHRSVSLLCERYNIKIK